jgi:hypothetical protein
MRLEDAEMEELLELRELLVEGNIHDALLLVGEMTEMSKDDLTFPVK